MKNNNSSNWNKTKTITVLCWNLKQKRKTECFPLRETWKPNVFPSWKPNVFPVWKPNIFPQKEKILHQNWKQMKTMNYGSWQKKNPKLTDNRSTPFRHTISTHHFFYTLRPVISTHHSTHQIDPFTFEKFLKNVQKCSTWSFDVQEIKLTIWRHVIGWWNYTNNFFFLSHHHLMFTEKQITNNFFFFLITTSC